MDDFDMREEVKTLFFFIYQRKLLVMLKSFGMSQHVYSKQRRRGYENRMHAIHHTEACKSVTRISFNKEVKAEAMPLENNLIASFGVFLLPTNVVATIF